MNYQELEGKIKEVIKKSAEYVEYLEDTSTPSGEELSDYLWKCPTTVGRIFMEVINEYCGDEYYDDVVEEMKLEREEREKKDE